MVGAAIPSNGKPATLAQPEPLAPGTNRSYIEETLLHFSAMLNVRTGQTVDEWLEELLEAIGLQFIALQGGIYLRSTRSNSIFRLAAAFGTHPDNLRTRLKVGDGLSGQALLNGKRYVVNVPQAIDLSVRSGAVSVRPQCLLIQPLSYQGEIEALLELATAYDLKDLELEAIARLSETLAGNLRFQRIQERTKESLERQVRARTRQLEETLDNLKNAQTQMLQAEKLATLGQLVAGVAHEINTPIGAIKASGTTLLEMLPHLLHDTAVLLPALPALVRDLTNQLVQVMLEDDVLMPTREERRLKKEFRQLLEAAQVPDAFTYADEIVAAGFKQDLGRFLPIFQDSRSRELLDYLLRQGQLIRNLRNIRVAAEKTTKIVFALKNFSHTSEAGAMNKMSVVENIETLLILYHNQFKGRVEVVTYFEDNLPYILGNPDELSQVWTNIMQNAAHAMNMQGQISIRVTRTDFRIRVEITDNGPGIPKEIQDKIFQAFFTTKGRGEGTGLGLDICKRIVEKHGGRIYVDTEPGRTSFFIELPVPAEALQAEALQAEAPTA